MFRSSDFKAPMAAGNFSSEPKVYNKHQANIPVDAVYIGRPTQWGNPFSHVPNGTLAEHIVASRDEAVDQYEKWLSTQPKLIEAAKKELKGKSLVCWCSPKRCHGDVLIKIANSY